VGKLFACCNCWMKHEQEHVWSTCFNSSTNESSTMFTHDFFVSSCRQFSFSMIFWINRRKSAGAPSFVFLEIQIKISSKVWAQFNHRNRAICNRSLLVAVINTKGLQLKWSSKERNNAIDDQRLSMRKILYH